MARKTPGAARAGKKTAKAPARKTTASKAGKKAGKKAAKKASKKTGAKAGATPAAAKRKPATGKASGKASAKPSGKSVKKSAASSAAARKASRTSQRAPASKKAAPAKKARAAKAARRVAAKKATARKTSALTSARKTLGAKTAGRKTGARKTASKQTRAKATAATRGKVTAREAAGAAAAPKPSPRRSMPLIAAGRRAEPRTPASREALAKKTLAKPTTARKPTKKAGGKSPARSSAAKAPSIPRAAATPAGKPPRSGVVRRAGAALTTPLLRDSARRRVEKPTAPRPEKRPAPARKPPFRPHALGVRDAHATDRPQIEALLAKAFGGADEAQALQRQQDAGEVLCALVAEYEGELIGLVGFSRAEAHVDGRSVKAAALACLAVAPDRQGRGVGSVLMSAGLEAAGGAGVEAVFTTGGGDYPHRFGFSAQAAGAFESPADDPLLAVELKPGCLAGESGTLVVPPGAGPSSAR